MSIKRQILYLRSDRADTVSALNEKGVEDIQRHGFDQFPNDIRSIRNQSPTPIFPYTTTQCTAVGFINYGDMGYAVIPEEV